MSKPIIIIPSKDIYDIDNSKVIDNQITKIEAPIVVPQIINATENVYNETVTSAFYPQNKETAQNYNAYSTGGIAYLSLAFIHAIPAIQEKIFIFSKTLKNKKIINILTGIDNNGNANIKYSLRGTIKKGTVIGSVGAEYSILGGLDLKDLNIEKMPPTEIYTDTSYELDREFTYTQQGAGDYSTNVTVNLALTKYDNVDTAENLLPNDNYNFAFRLSIFSGIEILKFGGTTRQVANHEDVAELNGTYEEYIPTQVDVSFYGDTISLDLENDTITIGSENDTFSLQGNELIQSTNTPAVASTCQKIIDEWKDGKEIATIRCAVTNYSDVNGIGVIGGAVTVSDFTYVSFDGEETYTYKAKISEKLPENAVIEFKYGEDNEPQELRIKNVLPNGYANLILFSDYSLADDLQDGKQPIIHGFVRGRPQVFNLGDIVQPYVFGANEQDKPMSLYKNLTPKNFEVLQTKFIYDGSPEQEISIQEIKQEE